MLEKIKNGGELSDRDAFILNCDDPQKILEYSKFDDIKNRIQDNNAITLNDFNFLCEAMKLDPHTKRLLEIGYKSKGLISEFKPENSENITNKTTNIKTIFVVFIRLL